MARYNLGKFWKGRKQPEKVRKKDSLSLKDAYKQGRHKKVWLNKHFSQEHKEKIRESNKKAWKSITLRISHIKQARKRWQSNSERKKQSEKLKKIWQSQELRKEMSKKLKLYARNPKIRKQRAEIAKRIWKEKPYLEENCRRGLLVYLQTHPEALIRIATLGKNPLKPIIKTKQDYKVRSKGEKAIADFAYKNSIKTEYEKYNLFFPETWTNPDFYLPEYNILIEFYGGHPRAWKKKVLKNILYKKYKIPVIAITPKELENLNYYLLEEIEKTRKSRECKNFKLSYWTNPLNKTRMGFLKELKKKFNA